MLRWYDYKRLLSVLEQIKPKISNTSVYMETLTSKINELINTIFSTKHSTDWLTLNSPYDIDVTGFDYIRIFGRNVVSGTVITIYESNVPSNDNSWYPLLVQDVTVNDDGTFDTGLIKLTTNYITVDVKSIKVGVEPSADIYYFCK